MHRAQLIREVLENHPRSSQNIEIKAATWWQENWQSQVFTDEELRKRIPKSIYEIHKATIKEHRQLDILCADVVANAMKEWAISHGATHYTHWFQPIHMSTSEKHEAFYNTTSPLQTIMVS